MRLLCIDTSSWCCGVALVSGEPAGAATTVAEWEAQVDDSHSIHLLPRIEALLLSGGWARDEMDGFVATVGPGSFTGIRVALGTIRGLSLALDRPCAGVSTLDAMAEAHGAASGPRVAILPAGRGEVYSACYAADRSPAEPLAAPTVGPLSKLAMPRDAVPVLGPVVDDALIAAVREKFGPSASIAPTRGLAAAAGRLVVVRDALHPDRLAPLSPLYIRPPDAEIKRRSR